MNSVNFRLSPPRVTNKKFVKNANGNYVLSYSIGNAKINKGRNESTRLSPLSHLVNAQHQQIKRTTSLKNKSQIMKVLQTNPCS